MRAEPALPGKAWLLSTFLHGIALAMLLAYTLFSPKPPPTVAVFELVSTERPKLRPLAPKTPEPPPEIRQSRPPEAPTLAPKPKSVAPAKPEPKQVRPAPPDPSLPVKDVPGENSVPRSSLTAPSDPRLAMWAGRVQKMVEARWNPPAGIDVQGRVKTVVSFEVERSGRILSVEVAQSSGNALLDDLAKRTIQRLETVMQIPGNFPGDLLKVSYEFVYAGN